MLVTLSKGACITCNPRDMCADVCVYDICADIFVYGIATELHCIALHGLFMALHLNCFAVHVFVHSIAPELPSHWLAPPQDVGAEVACWQVCVKYKNVSRSFCVLGERIDWNPISHSNTSLCEVWKDEERHVSKVKRPDISLAFKGRVDFLNMNKFNKTMPWWRWIKTDEGRCPPQKNGVFWEFFPRVGPPPPPPPLLGTPVSKKKSVVYFAF